MGDVWTTHFLKMTIWATPVGRLGDSHRDVWATKMDRGSFLYAPIVSNHCGDALSVQFVAECLQRSFQQGKWVNNLGQNFRVFPLE